MEKAGRVPHTRVWRVVLLTFLSFALIFNLTSITVVILYSYSTLHLDPVGAFLFCTAGLPWKGLPARASALLSKQIPKLNSQETFMSSLSPKDRVSLCSFTFSDGRRCRTPGSKIPGLQIKAC